MNRRNFMTPLCCSMLAGTVSPLFAQQLSFPSRPVKIVVAYPPGGPNDTIARVLGQRLGEMWSQSVIIENRAGAGGIIGSEMVARAPADGYTLMLGSITHAILPGLNPHLPFDPINDFTPISMVGVAPMLVVVHPSVPATNVRELIELAKSQPGKLFYASTGNGTSIHLVTEMFKREAGVDIVHVPYNGSGPAMAALVSGQVQMMIEAMPSALPQAQAGRIRALAVTSPKRSPFWQDLPTVSEALLPGFDAGIWWGVLGPARIPNSVTNAIAASTNQALHSPEVRSRFAALGINRVGTSPGEFAKVIQSDVIRYARVIREAKITVD